MMNDKPIRIGHIMVDLDSDVGILDGNKIEPIRLDVVPPQVNLKLLREISEDSPLMVFTHRPKEEVEAWLRVYYPGVRFDVQGAEKLRQPSKK